MPEEFEGDLAEAVFWGADLSRAVFRDVDLTGARISHSWVADVEIDAFVERLVVNGVDVTAYVNASDRWYPLRAMLRPSEPAEFVATWQLLTAEWSTAIGRAERLGSGAFEKVGGEFSFVETIRHLVFASDKWFTVAVLGRQFDPIGLPNRGSLDFPWPNLDASARPSLADALAVRADRSARVDNYLAQLAAGAVADSDAGAIASSDAGAVAELTREVEVLENGPHPIRDCLYAVLEEEFWHLRYADRDLAALESQADPVR